MDEGLREKSWRKVEMELWPNGYGSLVMRELRDKMCDPTLLDVLAKKLHKLLSKLQAHGRARKPKEKKATRKQSGKKHKTKAQIFKEAKLEARANASHDDFEAYVPNHKVGRDHLHKGHNNKFFKENFKPP